MTARRPLTIVAVTLGLWLLAAAAAPAAPPNGGITAPSEGTELTALDQVAVNVNFSAGGQVTRVALSLESLRGKKSDARDFDVNAPSFNYTWQDFAPGMLDYNGGYRARAEATGTDGTLDPSGPETTVSIRKFRLAIPPVSPENTRTAFNESARTVVVSWTGNPEPDLIGYLVQRAPKDGEYSHVAEVPRGETAYTDDVGELGSGTYTYRVVALREGAYTRDELPDGATYVALNSNPSRPATTTITAPPAPNSEPDGGTSTTSGTNPTTTSQKPALASAGKVVLSNFARLLDQNRRAAAVTTTEPDAGFESELPYAARPTTSEPAATEAPEPQVVLSQEDPDADDDDRLRSMKFFAGGLFAFVLMMHLVWVKGEVDRAPLEATDPSDESDPVDSDAPGEADTREPAPVQPVGPVDAVEERSPLDIAPLDPEGATPVPAARRARRARPASGAQRALPARRARAQTGSRR